MSNTDKSALKLPSRELARLAAFRSHSLATKHEVSAAIDVIEAAILEAEKRERYACAQVAFVMRDIYGAADSRWGVADAIADAIARRST